MGTDYYKDELKKIGEIVNKTAEINKILDSMGLVAIKKDEVKGHIFAINRYVNVYKRTLINLDKLANQ